MHFFNLTFLLPYPPLRSFIFSLVFPFSLFLPSFVPLSGIIVFAPYSVISKCSSICGCCFSSFFLFFLCLVFLTLILSLHMSFHYFVLFLFFTLFSACFPFVPLFMIKLVEKKMIHKTKRKKITTTWVRNYEITL